MKNLTCLMLMLASILSSYAQEVLLDPTTGNDIIVLGGNENLKAKEEPVCVNSLGDYVRVYRDYWAPSLAWNIEQCTYPNGTSVKKELLTLLTVTSGDYHSFDSESRVLLRFTDESVSILRRDLNFEVERTYDNTWISGNLVDLRYSIVFLQLDSETRKKLFNQSLGIKKVRVVFSNGDAKDYDIKGKGVMKLPEELRASYVEATQDNNMRTQNSDDSTF